MAYSSRKILLFHLFLDRYVVNRSFFCTLFLLPYYLQTACLHIGLYIYLFFLFFFIWAFPPLSKTAKNRGLFFTVLGNGGRALRHYALASVLRSTAHCSLRRLATIPNAVILCFCCCLIAKI